MKATAVATGCCVLALATPSASAAEVSKSVVHTWSVTNPCALDGAGETVFLTGRGKITLQEVLDGSGATHYVVNSAAMGVSGTGLTTGLRYRLIESTTQKDHGGLSGEGPWVLTQTGTQMMVAPGPDNDLVYRYTVHITATPQGDITAAVFHFEDQARCR